MPVESSVPVFSVPLNATVFVPVVLAYQIWNYVVFRRRVTGPPVSAEPSSPADQGVPA